MTLCTLLHGAGSTPEFIHRAFGPAVGAAGAALVAPDIAGSSIEQVIALLEEMSPGPQDVIGGVSLGAHAAAAFAARTGWTGRLYLVMPAWLGSPGDVAALNTVTARDLRRHGTTAVLDALAPAGTGDWVFDELHAAWSSMPASRLITALEVASQQPAPTCSQLRSVRASSGLVALRDDPTHPLAAAARWHACLPESTLTVMPRDLDGRGPTALAEPLSRLLSGSQ